MRFIGLLLLIAAGAHAADKVITFDDGPGGFSADNDKLKFGVTTDKSFDGKSKSLQVSGATEYVGLSLYQKVTDNDTRFVLIYWAEGFNGDIVMQGGSAAMKKNVHAMVAQTVQGQWAVAEVKLGNFADWNGKAVPKGDSLSFLQIYGNPAPGGKPATLYLSRVAIIEGEDRTPPAAPTGLAAEVKDHAVEVHWDPAKDNVVTAKYEVYRGMKPDFTAGPANRVADVSSVTLRDDTLSNFGTYYYRVLPIDAAGNRGPVSDAVKIDVVGD
jgi:hypothetical protein